MSSRSTRSGGAGGGGARGTKRPRTDDDQPPQQFKRDDGGRQTQQPQQQPGILLDLDDGSLRFFKNGVEHGPGYPAGSVTGPVALVAQMYNNNTGVWGTDAVRLLPDAEWPAGHDAPR